MDYFRSPAYAARIEALMLKHRIPGMAVAVTHAGTTESAGFGSACLDPPRACTGDTLFDVASCSKSMTAASVALLVEDDENHPDVEWDAPMEKLLPDDFVMPGREHGGVTVEDMLSHRTSMYSHSFACMGQKAARPDDALSVTRNLRNLSIAGPLRTSFIYCSRMFTAATLLVERRSGISFPDFLEQRFFRPLSMSSSFLQPGRARAAGMSERMATGYAWDSTTQSYRGFQPLEAPEAQGAGCIMSSANDYIRWVSALLRREGPVSQEVYDGLVRQRSFADPGSKDVFPNMSPIYYAAGLETFYYRGHTVIGHDGLVCGFTSRIFFLPDLDFGAVIFGNSSDASPLVDVLGHELIDALLEVPEAERPDWERLEYGKPIPEGEMTFVEKTEKKLREEMAGGGDPEPLKMPLACYTGDYWNVGYRCLKVEERDGALFIDATDRGSPSTCTFEHVSGQTMFLARLKDIFDEEVDPMKAEFRFEGEKAMRLGMHLEDELEEPIWFERVQSSA